MQGHDDVKRFRVGNQEIREVSEEDLCVVVIVPRSIDLQMLNQINRLLQSQVGGEFSPTFLNRWEHCSHDKSWCRSLGLFLLIDVSVTRCHASSIVCLPQG